MRSNRNIMNEATDNNNNNKFNRTNPILPVLDADDAPRNGHSGSVIDPQHLQHYLAMNVQQ